MAESCSAMPVESKTVIWSSDWRPSSSPQITLPISPAMSSSAMQALAQRDVDLAVRTALADVVDEDARPLQDARVELLLALEVGAERGEMRAGRDPRVVDDPAARVGARDDDVGAAHDLLEIGRRR